MHDAVRDLHEFQQLRGALLNFAPRKTLEMKWQGYVLQAIETRQQIEKLEDEPNFLAPQTSESSSESPATVFPISPDVGRSSPPIKLSKVDFPEPDGPTMETISPRSMWRFTWSSATTWRLPL
jgi:hypothetical protein